MDWRAWIQQCYAGRDTRPDFRDAATPQQLAEVETALGCALPHELRELLMATDGVGHSMHVNGELVHDIGPVWSCAEMIENNRTIRALRYIPPTKGEPLYFAYPGVDSVLFAFLGDEIFCYQPIESRWSLISPSLKEHLTGWRIR